MPHARRSRQWRKDSANVCSTLALQNGVDIKTVSGMPGDYDAGFTLRTYAHATDQMQEQTAAMMGNLMAQAMWYGKEAAGRVRPTSSFLPVVKQSAFFRQVGQPPAVSCPVHSVISAKKSGVGRLWVLTGFWLALKWNIGNFRFRVFAIFWARSDSDKGSRQKANNVVIKACKKSVEMTKNRHFWRFFAGGGRWIRTTEVTDNRFTVCPLWPLGNSPIFNSARRKLMELVDGFEPPTC